MTLQQMKYVICVADRGSMNEAAKALYISQPSLSGTIKELEKEIGDIAGFINTYGEADFREAETKIIKELAEKTSVLGNASLAGASMVLSDEGARARLRDIQRACRYIELSGDRDFNEEYPEQMFFYEEDDDEWN